MAYNLGGLHAGLVMFLIVSLIAQIIIRYNEVDTVCFSAFLLVGVLAISVFAYPAYRHKQKHHDYFEYSHRFIGWLLAVVVIVQIVYTTVVTNGDLWRSASTYLLVCSVFLVTWPWITMKKVTMDIDAPSKMVTTLTTAQSTAFACAGTTGRVSFGFASHYHSFAILNALTGDKGTTFTVSSVGDWTLKLNAKGSEGGGVYPSHVPKPHTMYVRRFAAPGFMYLARTYKRVVCVGTGAGIAPIASYLPDPTTNMLLLWVGRDFKSTYGAL